MPLLIKIQIFCATGKWCIHHTHVHLNMHSHTHTHTPELISVIMPTVDVFFQNQFKIFKPFEIFAGFTQIFVTMFYKNVHQMSFTIF